MTPDSVTIEDVLTKRDLVLGDVLELRKIAMRSDADRTALTNLDRDFDKVVAPKLPKEAHSFRKAWCAWALRRTDEARQALSRFRQNGLASFMLGKIAEESEDMPEAVVQYKEAMSELKTEADAALAHANALRRNGQPDKATSELDKIEKKFGENPHAAAQIAYQRGAIAEDEGDIEGALDLYEKALEIMPNHIDAAFRTGSIYDLRGKDDKAAEYYGRCAEGGICHTGAMVNLALLLEDKGEYERAIACYRDVLRAEPNNRRARLFMSGAVESTEEVYDEVERKEREKLDQILRTPVSEFELSVRSRNVLSRMNIRTLGDLVQRTESEMLAYRNFGETSLREIKQLLTAKGLRLGLGRNEVERRQKRERLALVMSDKDSRVLSTPVSEMNLSVRSRRCMARLNIQTVGDLITRSAEELTATKNFGQTSLTEIREKLAQMGLSLRSAKEPPPVVEEDDTEELAVE